MKRVLMAVAVVLLAAGVAADGTLDEGKQIAYHCESCSP